MNTQLKHFKITGDRFASLIDLTADGFRAEGVDRGNVALLQVVIGALLMLGIALIALRIA